ncbi:hypothetical protein HYS54_01285 [Candidatus Micrarchaeota archaeon]|nr:hypothetical protein [Candidatus Micrarchaeota archaeon]
MTFGAGSGVVVSNSGSPLNVTMYAMSGTLNFSLNISNTNAGSRSNPIFVSGNGTMGQLNVTVFTRNKSTYTASHFNDSTMAVTASAGNVLCYIFHNSSVTERYEITKAWFSVIYPGSGASTDFFKVSLHRITAEAGTPAGQVLNVSSNDPDSGESDADPLNGVTGAIVRGGAAHPTYSSCGFANAAGGCPNYQYSFHSGLNDSKPIYILDADGMRVKPLIIRAGVTEGYVMNITNGANALTTAGKYACGFEWTEE